MPRKKSPSAKDASFETTIKQLEGLVEGLEGENMSLEEAMVAFESGIKLVREAQKALEEAEQKVALLTETEDGDIEEEFLEEDPE